MRSRQGLVLLSIVFLGSIAHAGVPENVLELREKIDKEHRLLLDSEIRKRGILGTLYDINKSIQRINGDMTSIEDQLQTSHKTAQGYAKSIVRLEKILNEQKMLLRIRLRALYKMGLRGYAEVLLSSRSGSEFSRNMKFLKVVIVRDNKLIEDYKSNLTALARQQKKLREQVRLLAQLERDLSKEKKKYSEQRQKQLFLLAQIDQDRDSHLQALREWRQAGKKLDEKLTQLGMQSQLGPELTRGSFFEQRGTLKPPVIGEVIQKYGLIINQRFETKIFHKGLFFSVRPGDKISSLFWGKVAYAGWINGYGETIIIDHGDHYYSLYAHNSKLEKRIGDPVTSGEVIAEAGDTGSLRGPGLYMEIRHFSESLDPMPWLDLRKTSRL
jgi:murein hydrolase activator